MLQNRVMTAFSVIIVMALTGWFWLRGERFIQANGPTFDEGVHLVAGYSYWKTGDFHLNGEDPPFMKLLWALPAVFGNAPNYPVEVAAETNNHWQIADVWMYRSGQSPQSLLEPARKVNLAIGCCVIVLVGWCAYRIWGSHLTAIAASAFAASDPTLLSLSCILSTDAGLTFFSLLTCYLTWEYVANPSRGLLFATGISLGLLLVTKFSSIGFVIGLGLAGMVYLWRGGTLTLPGKTSERGYRPALELAIRLGAIAIVTIAATYAFIHFGQWTKGIKFQLLRANNDSGEFFLDGEINHRGWFHYFIVALLVKLPLGLLVAASISLVICVLNFAKRSRMQTGVANERETPCQSKDRTVWLIVPPLVFFALASYSRVDMGIRVVLPVLPFLYLLAGGLAKANCCRAFCGIVIAGCLAWCSFVVVRSSPHELSYFNELAGMSTREAPIVADSNLDWGQGLPALKKWMEAEQVNCIYLGYFGTDRPESHGIRYQQLPGYGCINELNGESIPENATRHIVAVSVNHLFGLYLKDPNCYSWLRARKPIATLDGSIRVFDLTDDLDAVKKVRSLSPQ